MSARMRRLAALLTVLALALAVPAPVALAQQGGGSGAFGPLPQAPQETATPAPTATPQSTAAQNDTDRTLLYVIGACLIVLFVVIARVITRDARSTLRSTGHDGPEKARDEGPHKHARQAKAKARAKTKAQRRARRENR